MLWIKLDLVSLGLRDAPWYTLIKTTRLVERGGKVTPGKEDGSYTPNRRLP